MRRDNLTRRVCGGLFGIYVCLMVYLLFLQRKPAADYWEFLLSSPNLIPFATLRTQLVFPMTWPQIKQVGGNILMFLPLGLLPAIWKRQRTYRVFLLTVTLTILTVELLQWLTTLGFADIDDLILNQLGASIGYVIWKRVTIKKEGNP